MPATALAARRAPLVLAMLATALVMLLSGCGPTEQQAATSTLVKDASLTRLLVTSADFPDRNWAVTDVTDKAIEAAKQNKDSGTATPAECDGSKMTSMAGGAVASVASGGIPQTMVILSRDSGAEDPAEVIRRWVQQCGTFKIEMDKGSAVAHAESVPTPQAGPAGQAGYRYTVTVESLNGVSASTFGGGDLSFVGYTTRIGDITVSALSVGGEGWGGKDMQPDVPLLDAAYLAQVDRVKRA